MSKKDTEVTVRDTEDGVELLIGKKVIGKISESEDGFLVTINDRSLTSFKQYEEAEEEVIRQYNLAH